MIERSDVTYTVSRSHFTGDLTADVRRTVQSIDGWACLHTEGTLLVKPNYNTAHPPPGSTAPDFLRSVFLLLREQGIRNLMLGESTSSLRHRKVLDRAGAFTVAREFGVPVIVFDEQGWENVAIGGRYLKRAKLAKILRHVDRILYVCCPKAHHATEFTGSLKLGMGFVHSWWRTLWHLRNLQEKIADLNLVLNPDLILADMRRTFISGGPARGTLREPGLLLASKSRVTLDLEAIRTIQDFRGHDLGENPWSIKQIGCAVDLGLGPSEKQSYKVIEA